jgi:hypothetical protein
LLPLLIESIVSVYLGHEFDSFNLRCHFVALEAGHRENEREREKLKYGTNWCRKRVYTPEQTGRASNIFSRACYN